MAKAKSSEKKGNKGQGGRKGGNGGAGPGRAADMIEKSEAGRARKRNVRKYGDRETAVPSIEKPNWAKLNEGFHSDIFSLLEKKKAGNYAFPSGNAPALRLNAYTKRTDKGESFVIQVIDIQKGHELTGNPVNDWTYIHADTIREVPVGKFISKFEGTPKSVQEMLHAYLGTLYRERKRAERKAEAEAEAKQKSDEAAAKKAEAERKLAEAVATASDDVKKLEAGEFGNYKLPNGIIIAFEDMPGKKGGVIKVVKSVEGSKLIAGEFWFLPAGATRKDMFKQPFGISKDRYAWMCELHALVRMFLKDGIRRKEEPEAKEGPVDATVVTTKAKTSVDVSGAIEMTASAFLGTEGKYFRAVDGRNAYFSVMRMGGNKSIAIVAVEEGFAADHVLARIMREHEDGIHIPLETLNRNILVQSFDEDNLKDPKEARKALLQFLWDTGRALGLRPATKKPAPSAPAISPEKIREVAEAMGGRVRVVA